MAQFTRDMSSIMKESAADGRVIDKYQASDRKKICITCIELDKRTWVCAKCGCFMNYKSLFVHAKCPLGKWSAIKDKE